ncbi:hypothetical protein SteCoe_18695 [Stentor coeruleus]|uniref:Receptor ligand binding region domain-containing protein n=1 Tax=Stentor coeruleus TaxID=5963 RepID=A0A1R2BVY9_9CILI|nr:hypothetical protein SteCoe_18695 [Stentor coeruleus]
MLCIFLNLLQLVAGGEFPVVMIISENTPSSFLSKLESSTFNELFDSLIITLEDFSPSSFIPETILVDFTFSVVLGMNLQTLGDIYGFNVISTRYLPYRYPNEQFFLLQKPEIVSSAMTEMLNYLEWTQFIVFSSEELYYREILDKFLEANPTQVKNCFVLHPEMDELELENMISKMIKTTSFRLFVIISSKSVSNLVVSAIIKKKIFSAGTGILIYGEGLAGLSSQGILGLVQNGIENYLDIEDNKISQLLGLLDYIAEKKSSNIEKQFKEILNEYYKTGKEIFNIINIQNDEKIVIGSLNNTNIELFINITFPGNMKFIDSNFKTQIPFSYAGGQANPPGIPPSGYNPLQMRGAKFATMVANNDTSLLPNFNFSMIYTDCGVSTSNATYIYSCLDNIPELGVGFLSTSWGTSTVPYIDYFLPKPVISSDTYSGLSDKKLYPTMIRAVPSSNYNGAILANTLKVFGWNKIMILRSDTQKYYNAYQVFLGLSKYYGIKILNVNDNITIPYLYTRDQFENYRGTFQACYDSGARIFISLLPSSDYLHVVEGLYDVGFRRGDLQALSTIATGGNICGGELDEHCIKRKELLIGALGVYNAEWIGDYGKEMEQRFIKAFDSFTAFQCTSFDQNMMLLRSISQVVKSGFDYEDSQILIKYIRQEKFVGCSGILSISQDSNDRSNAASMLQNIILDNDTVKERKVVVFDPSSQTPMQLIDDIIWCDGTKVMPNDYRFSLNCPFDETKATDSKIGYTVLYIVCFIIALITIVISLIMIKSFFAKNYEEINCKKIITGQDMIALIIIIIEIFQYLSLGITPTDSSSIIETLSEVSGVNFRKFFIVENSAYWNMILISIIVAWIYCLLCLMIILRSKSLILFRTSFFTILDYISEYLMPLIGDLSFMPIISVLMNLYVCTLSISNDLTKSYNSHDCNTFCWTGKHLSYSAISFITLAIFIPFSMYLRPFWHSFQTTLNIKPNQKYMIFKSSFQIFVIVLSKTVAYSNRYVFGFLYTGVLLTYSLSFIKFKAFNYGIANLWLAVSIFMTAYTELLYSISILSEFSGSNVLAALICGNIGIVSLGYYIQSRRCVSYLYSEPSKNIPEIFKYAFGKNEYKYKENNDDDDKSSNRKIS